MAILQTNDIFKTELSEGQHRLSPEEIHKVQQVVYGITIDITELCSELNIPYMLTGGTALGAVRHGGFIPWDDDVDMVVERKYIERLLDAIEQRYPDRYFVEAPLRTPGYLSSFIQIHRKNTVCREYLEIPEERCGIKIDIFVVENTYDNAFLRRLHGMRVEAGLLLLSCYRMYLWRNEFYKLSRGNKLRSDFLCAQKRKFEDREFLFPKNIDWYLSYMYGNYMEIPPEDKREYHVVYQLKI